MIVLYSGLKRTASQRMGSIFIILVGMLGGENDDMGKARRGKRICNTCSYLGFALSIKSFVSAYCFTAARRSATVNKVSLLNNETY